MYGLALGIARVKETLPDPVYGLITGLNAATVGLIAQAGVQLSRKAITDGLSRSILIISACAGLCYSALWYFPVLMTAAGIAAVIYDLYLRRALFRFRIALRRTYLKLRKRQTTSGQDVQRESVHEMTDQASHDSNSASQATEAEGARPPFTIRLVPGLTVIGLFFALFVTLMGLRAHFSKLVELRLFTNMVLAGTIIFGGGPVVIPLLREYVVQEGWVSSRDFLLGLAIIQSFPGPNFNFSVYLGALASASTSTPSWVTALLAYIGIFLPGLMLTTGMSSIWARIPRQYRPFVSSLLRGINAAAVGLIWTAVYRLWNAGNLTHSSVAANSLGSEPWWLVVATAAFAGHQWYSVPAPLCIVLGGCMGLGWWAVN
ncbi:hypothetical protein FRC18_004192 [Serendipita sp. 400]|nr:hypothetical protein FRC18_004192 [Serendipita sp. 400]